MKKIKLYQLFIILIFIIILTFTIIYTIDKVIEYQVISQFEFVSEGVYYASEVIETVWLPLPYENYDGDIYSSGGTGQGVLFKSTYSDESFIRSWVNAQSSVDNKQELNFRIYKNIKTQSSYEIQLLDNENILDRVDWLSRRIDAGRIELYVVFTGIILCILYSVYYIVSSIYNKLMCKAKNFKELKTIAKKRCNSFII